MTKFDTFGHISPCRWGRRGKKLFKPEYISGQGPTQKKIDQFADPCAGKLIFSCETLGYSIDWTPEHVFYMKYARLALLSLNLFKCLLKLLDA